VTTALIAHRQRQQPILPAAPHFAGTDVISAGPQHQRAKPDHKTEARKEIQTLGMCAFCFFSCGFDDLLYNAQ